jgi:hypothetical protein
MPTFNGWEIIATPTDPPAPSTMEFTGEDLVAVSVSPFTGQQQVQDWGASFMEASVSLPPLTHAQAQAWIAFMLSLHGQANVFQLGDPLAVAPKGAATGTPVVDGAGQTGYVLNLRGWTPSTGGLLLPGDWIQIGYRLYRTISCPASGLTGALALTVWPQIRESPADGTAVILNNTQGLWRLQKNATKWSITAARVYGMQFDITEAI